MRTVTAFGLLILFVLLPVQSQEPSENPQDLSELKARFQSILDEIEGDTTAQTGYESSVANLLSKVDNLQRSSSETTLNITLNWFSKSGAPTSAPWMSAPLRIVLVVSSFEGMYLNSGIGTFYAALSDFLVHHGHSVTILYTRAENSTEKATFIRWKTSFEKRGVAVVRLEASRVKITVSQLAQKSYQIYTYLKAHQEDFDAVHFPEWEGPGYYTTLAKQEGLAFHRQIMIVGLHGPWRWVKAGNYKGEKGMLTQAEDFETDWMERKSAEYADVVLTPSEDMVQWLLGQGWSLPAYEKGNMYLMPFLPGREISKDSIKLKNVRQESSPALAPTNAAAADSTPASGSSSLAPAPVATNTVTELVFFGRLEKRKGLDLFADALDKLTVKRPEFQDIKITFLGRPTNIGGQSATSYLDLRASNGQWPFRVTHITHKDRKGALEYLRAEKGRVAIIPSLVENSPYTVYECLFLGIPFVATNLPSISALIYPEDRARALTAVDSVALSEKLEQLLDEGSSPIRSAFDLEKLADSWVAFYEAIAKQVKVAKETASSDDDFQPLVSVCVTHFNRPEFLAMALDSIYTQTYKNFEIILVDDGSTAPEAIAYVDSLKAEFDAKDWKIAKTRNQYLGAARNTAAKLARGEYLLFLDDDNIARPAQIATYVAVAGKTGSDILTAIHDVFQGTGLPDETPQTTNILSRSVPIGPSAPLGIFKNCFGDANFFIQKSSFMQIGGFTEDKGVGQEDHEFLAKAVLGGYQLMIVPEPLLFYRMHNKTQQMIHNTDPIKNHLRAKRPYEEVSSDAESLDLLKILAFENKRSARDVRSLQAVCNMTVHSVDPTRIPSMTTTSLSLMVSSIDCGIKTILIGTLECTNAQVVSATMITCDSPTIAVPDDYPIKFIYREDPSNTVDTGISLEVYQATSPNYKTNGFVSMVMDANSDTYSANTLTKSVANIAGTDPSNVVVASDTVDSTSKRGVMQTHHLVLVVSSTTPGNSANDICSRLVQALTADPTLLANVGSVKGVGFLATCDNTGACECSPNYQGVGCATPAACPNDCSGNGKCVDGTYSRVCKCYTGYTGKDCSSGMCSAACSAHGTCIITPGQNGTCSCNAGWSGVDCTVATGPTCVNNCNNRGNCTNGVCSCQAGWSGTACETASSGPDNVNKQSTSKSGGTSPGITAFAVVVSVLGFALIIVVIVAVYKYHKRRQNEMWI